MEDFMADYAKKYPDACKSDKEWRNALNWELAKNDSEFRRPFEAEFKKAKKRVRKMGFRVVKIEDSIDQAIFEIYAHKELDTPYNGFDVH